MLQQHHLKPHLLSAAIALSLLLLSGCGGDNEIASWTAPSAPTGLGHADSAPLANEATVPPYVDFGHSNQRGDARYATKDTNASVRALQGFLDIWQPLAASDGIVYVDAGVSAEANGSFPAVAKSTWSGVPGVSPDGKVLNQAVHNANIQYVINATKNRTSAQELAAYLDDRRKKGYSITDGLGPLTAAWRTAAAQTTTITNIPADATTKKYDDKGNDLGDEKSATFGTAVTFAGTDYDGSTEPAKRYFKYARPWRWSSNVIVAPSLEPAKSGSPDTDGGFVSGHTAEAYRDALMMAYMLPERYQELMTRAAELGENRILGGMHSPLDVIGGRIHGQSVIAYTLYSQRQGSKIDATAGTATPVTDSRKAAYDQAHSVLMAAVGASDLASFNAYAHSGTTATDRFADYATNKKEYLRRMTYGFSPIGDTTKPAVVPKGAEILLETRLPYLDDAQRRVVLKTTAFASGYPAMDDAEGWGRLNLFAAADGYGAFNGDVSVTMDASKGGFHAKDCWRNDITGAGLLTKQGSGALGLSGNNSYTGGTLLKAGTLKGTSASAFGKGDVYQTGGTLIVDAASALNVGARYTQTGGELQLVIGKNSQGRLSASSDITLGGTLNVKFKDGYKPAVGDVLNVISGSSVHGEFSAVTVAGYKASAVYGDNYVQLKITQ
ncbi:MAG: phosphatase PAP2 family protein [Halothiobacillaceae bacterium]|nr:phosphatase PAP2 family protein [Halothiobacillaceae bacterium]